MKNIVAFFKHRPKATQVPDPAMPAMLRAIALTEEQELSCDQVYALLDQFAEMIQRGEDASHLMSMVQKHLKMCPDCREEYEALLQMMEAPAQNEVRHR